MGMTAGDHVATQTEPQEFAKLVELVRRAQENEASLQSFLKDFRISEAELRAAIVALVRVQIVLNQRQTQVSREGNWLSLDSKSQWYIDQKQSIAVRAYEQASTYRRLQERRR
jgi:hypothetical protein